MVFSSGAKRRVRNWGLIWLAVSAAGVIIAQPGLGADSKSDDVVRFGEGDTVDIRDAAEHGDTAASRDIPHLPLREPPDTVEFNLDPGLSEETQAEIRGAVGLGAAYFRATGAGELPAVTIVASDDRQYLVNVIDTPTITEESWDQFQGLYFDGAVYLLANWGHEGYGAAWQRSDIVSIVVHELAHAVHAEMSGPVPGRGTPEWFVEGAAEVEAQTALHAFGLERFSDAINDEMLAARQAAKRLPSTKPPAYDAYTLGFLAVSYLTEGGDLSRMRDVFKRLSRGDSFDAAFAHVSGQSVTDFVTAFEAHRARNFPPYRGRIAGNARMASGDTSDLWASACSDDEFCSTVKVAPDGSFTLAVPDGRYRLQVYFTQHDGRSAYFSLDGPVLDYEEATVFPVFGATVEGLDLVIPADMLSE